MNKEIKKNPVSKVFLTDTNCSLHWDFWPIWEIEVTNASAFDLHFSATLMSEPWTSPTYTRNKMAPRGIETESIQDLSLVTGMQSQERKSCLSFSVFKMWGKTEVYRISADFWEELTLYTKWGWSFTSRFNKQPRINTERDSEKQWAVWNMGAFGIMQLEMHRQ